MKPRQVKLRWLAPRSEKGQMTAELAIVIPAVLLALVIIVNIGMFMAEAARFDRIVGEVARILATSSQDPAQVANQVLQESLGYSGASKGPFRATVEVDKTSELFMQKRTLRFKLEYQLFASDFLAGTGESAGVLLRNKTLVIFWNTGL